MTHSTNTAPSRTGRSAGLAAASALGRFVVEVTDAVATWAERRRQRLALEALPDHLLSDIGVSRADAENEAEKPFWRG